MLKNYNPVNILHRLLLLLLLLSIVAIVSGYFYWLPIYRIRLSDSIRTPVIEFFSAARIQNAEQAASFLLESDGTPMPPKRMKFTLDSFSRFYSNTEVYVPTRSFYIAFNSSGILIKVVCIAKYEDSSQVTFSIVLANAESGWKIVSISDVG